MRKFVVGLVLVVSLIGLAGCQDKDQSAQPSNKVGQDDTEKTYVDHGFPESKGPSSAPDVKGPTSAPPASSVSSVPQAQAVTTNENIRLTLPRKTE